MDYFKIHFIMKFEIAIIAMSGLESSSAMFCNSSTMGVHPFLAYSHYAGKGEPWPYVILVAADILLAAMLVLYGLSYFLRDNF